MVVLCLGLVGGVGSIWMGCGIEPGGGGSIFSTTWVTVGIMLAEGLGVFSVASGEILVV